MKSSLELSPPKDTSVQGSSRVVRSLYCCKRDKDRVKPNWGKIQITFYAEIGALRTMEAAARFIVEGEGKVNEIWTVFFSGLKSNVHRDFDPVLCDTLLKGV